MIIEAVVIGVVIFTVMAALEEVIASAQQRRSHVDEILLAGFVAVSYFIFVVHAAGG